MTERDNSLTETFRLQDFEQLPYQTGLSRPQTGHPDTEEDANPPLLFTNPLCHRLNCVP